jgi:hypothetical protein
VAVREAMAAALSCGDGSRLARFDPTTRGGRDFHAEFMDALDRAVDWFVARMGAGQVPYWQSAADAAEEGQQVAVVDISGVDPVSSGDDGPLEQVYPPLKAEMFDVAYEGMVFDGEGGGAPVLPGVDEPGEE